MLPTLALLLIATTTFITGYIIGLKVGYDTGLKDARLVLKNVASIMWGLNDKRGER